jgi:DNA-binding CsgD family transcriptional regulator
MTSVIEMQPRDDAPLFGARSPILHGLALAAVSATIDIGLPPRTRNGAAAGGESAARGLLDGVPLPAYLLASDRRLLARNAAAENDPLAFACIGMAYGRIVRFAGHATEPLERVFHRALHAAAATAVVTSRDAGRQALWRVSMGAVAARHAVGEAAVVMLIVPPASTATTLAALQRLYGLTTAEARVLASLLDDRRPREIAHDLGIAITTVRSHLKALFAKTCTRRQSELVALAWSAASIASTAHTRSPSTRRCVGG